MFCPELLKFDYLLTFILFTYFTELEVVVRDDYL